MVHPRLKRILSESSSAVSSPPDTTSDPGKPDPESEEQDPELESLANSNQRDSDAEQEANSRADPEYESSDSKMDISDEDADGAPKAEEEDVPAADASSDTQKPGDGTPSRMTTPSSDTFRHMPLADAPTPPEVSLPSTRDDPPQPPPGPSKSTSRSPSPPLNKDVSTVPPSTSRKPVEISQMTTISDLWAHLPPLDAPTPPEVYLPFTRDDTPEPPPEPSKSTSRSPSPRSTKDASPVPPSTSVSANRSPVPMPRPSLKIKLKLGARPSKVASEAEESEEKPTGRRGRRGKAKAKESVSTPLTFTLPARTRADVSEPSASSRPSASRSQSSHHSSAESEDAEDADAESENENDVQPEPEDPAIPDDDAMDVDPRAPSLRKRSAEDVESEEGDIPEDDIDDGLGDEDSEVLPGERKARLTARQAVLASMVGAEHVELETATSSRKKQLTSEEIALRREETARKRKNMSEKKLEDEKTETINRLLKKQSSRSRAKRSALLNSSVVPTPQSPHSGDEGESDAVVGATSGLVEQKESIIPGPAWRWVSNRAGMRFSVPNEAMELALGEVANADLVGSPQDPVKPKPPAICDVLGCEALRKYRLVHDFERGACGMEHLRMLTGAA